MATAFISINLMTSNYITNVENSLLNEGKIIEDIINQTHSRDFMISKIKEISEDINTRITLIDTGGKVVADSSVDHKDLENHGNRPEIINAKEDGVGVEQRYSSTLKINMYYVAQRVETKYDIEVIRLSVELDKINEINMKMIYSVGIATIFGILVAVGIGVRFLRGLMKPIKDLTLATNKIANGHYGESVMVYSDDEIGILANDFNKMSFELAETIDELNDANLNKRAILSSMINGVIAVDMEKRVLFANPMAKTYLNIEEEIEGKHVLEVLRDSLLYKQIENMLKTFEPEKVEVEIDFPEYRIFKLYSNPIKNKSVIFEKKGVVIIIEDITEMRHLENMRKEFVANVSHELKTPLTSIKGFAETLKEVEDDNVEIRKRFLNIIDIEAGRLTTLIEDLLSLSDIEKKNSLLAKEEVEVMLIINEVEDLLSAIANKKNISIHYNVDVNCKSLHGNVSWFKQMMINLIDNAIKYTPEGGEVIVTTQQLENEIEIRVKDNGIGIDEEHIPRLFERFYRVDKGRSRKIGGTGLGLAIVKHVVISFGGTISVESKAGLGTEFIVNMPV